MQEVRIMQETQEVKYPQSFTIKTKFDQEIIDKISWFKENNEYWYEKAQEAPSEISCKFFVLGFILADNFSFSVIDEQENLIKNEQTTLEDLKWLMAHSHRMQKSSWAKKIEDFQKKQGPLDN